jgi:hypothetical protein
VSDGFLIPGAKVTPPEQRTPLLPLSASKAVAVVDPNKNALVVYKDNLVRGAGGAAITTGALLAKPIGTAATIALAAAAVAIGVVTPFAAEVVGGLAVANLLFRVVSRPLVVLGAWLANESPVEASKKIFG